MINIKLINNDNTEIKLDIESNYVISTFIYKDILINNNYIFYISENIISGKYKLSHLDTLYTYHRCDINIESLTYVLKQQIDVSKMKNKREGLIIINKKDGVYLFYTEKFKNIKNISFSTEI
jgi:hypothetical protein